MNQQTIDAINTLGNFCGKRDIEELTFFYPHRKI